MDRSRFREFLHNAFDMTDDILLDRIFKYFDSDNDGYIGREEWIMGLSVFLKGILIRYISCHIMIKKSRDHYVFHEKLHFRNGRRAYTVLL